MATYRTILTTKGIQLVAASQASGVPIVLTDMAVGDGNGNPVTPNPGQVVLARERYRHTVNQLITVQGDASKFMAELIIPAEIGGFTIREVGLYTNQGDLFAVANVPNAYKPTGAEGSFGDTVVKMIFKVDNASVVTLVADPNVTVATHSWVLNNVNAARIIPGGLTNQILSKKSNADGDTEWRDASDGVTVIVFSREETQTLAASQLNIDLATITSEGAAVYIEGVRLRRDQFSVPTETRVTLASAYPAGTRVTVVQNEEVGQTDLLRRPNNLSDVLDKAAARNNLGLPNWLASSQIDWNQIINEPAYTLRWPTFAEVTDKPATYPPSAHNQDWSTIDNRPDTATRWPTWNEVTSKPSLFPPASHAHPEYVQKTGDTMTGVLVIAQASTESSSVTLNNTAGGGGSYSMFANGSNSVTGLAGSWGVYDNIAKLTRIYCDQLGAWTIPTTLDINNTSTNSTNIRLTNRASGGRSWAIASSGGNNAAIPAGSFFLFDNTASAIRMQIFGTGATRFYGSVTADGGFDTGSSQKLKHIEGPAPYGIAEVMKLDVVRGKYREEYNADGRERIFVIAEQLQAVVPEAVDESGVAFGGEFVPSIKIDQMIPLIIAALKDVANDNKRLREEVEKLKELR